MDSGRYWLTRHAFVCETEGEFVLLDLKKDQYVALARPGAAGLVTLVDGWPGAEEAESAGAASALAAERLAAELLRRGLLTSSRALGKSARAVLVTRPTSSLGRNTVEVTPRRVLAFAAAALSARLSLRWRSLEQTLDAVRKRKRRCCASGYEANHGAAAEVLSAFEQLRPLAFTAHRRCLFDSLALLNFLAHHGHFPDWVFGVRLQPFAAHCWIASGRVLYNDSPEGIAGYTPILVV